MRWFLFLLLAFSFHCNSMAQSIGGKIISVSYKNLIDCFPEFKNEEISSKVDLTKLNAMITEKFILTKSLKKERKVQYTNSEGEKMQLRLKYFPNPKGPQSTELQVFKVDAKGLVTEVKEFNASSKNPSVGEVNGLLQGARIASDENWSEDFYMHGLKTSIRTNLKAVEDLKIEDPALKKSVSCESQGDGAILCFCKKK